MTDLKDILKGKPKKPKRVSRTYGTKLYWKEVAAQETAERNKKFLEAELAKAKR